MITDWSRMKSSSPSARYFATAGGSIELAYNKTGRVEGTLPEPVARFFERLADVSNRPILYQAVAPTDLNPDEHRDRIKWLEQCGKTS